MRATVQVPATSANVGPGFDCFGLALDLCNEVTVDTDGVGVAWEGEGRDDLPTDGTDMVSATIASFAAGIGLDAPSFGLRGVNRIPLERGLGSSSAAAVAGIVLASVLLDLGLERDRYSVFAAAAQIEGHPDNAAPAVFGGFTIALQDRFVRRLEPDPSLAPAVLVPGVRLPTSEARAALPDQVSRADAIFNAAHAALMVEALTRDPALLHVALHDRLHQDARLALVPDVADVVDDLRRARFPVCVSGAGPSLVVFEDVERGRVEAAIELPPGWQVLRPGLRASGFDLSVA